MKKRKKVCYYDFKEFTEDYELDFTEESLYLFIVDASKKAFNIKRLMSYLFYVDNLYSKEDIINDAFIFSIDYFKERQSYSIKVLAYYLLNQLKYVNRKKRKHMDNVPFCETTENTYSEEFTGTAIENIDFIAGILDKLKPEESKLVEDYFFRDRTYQEIADSLGQNKSSVKRRMDKILLRIKNRLAIDNVTNLMEFLNN